MDNPYNNFDEFYVANYKMLYRIAYRITGSHEDTEELVDEAFIIFLRKSDEISIKNPPAYITGILSKLIGNYLKSQRREQQASIPLEMVQHMIEDPNGLHRSLSDCLPNLLLPWEREILILRYERNYSFQKIAAELGLREVSCRSRLFRAKAHCRELMLENEKKKK